ncbi:MAG: isochorismatase hydrolase [Promethearchaeota archaeon CR_4]|nr:MAG: isochorismatase hydrolase [Candidatus Lokiarchaeota archaeon CR_4]
MIYLADNHAENDKEFEIWGRHSIKGTYGAQVIGDLAPEPSDMLIPKTRYSGFYNTKLDIILKRAKVDSLVVTGTLTDICVLYTSADARNRDMSVVIVSDATASLSDDRQKWALEHAKSVLNAQIKTCSEVMTMK